MDAINHVVGKKIESVEGLYKNSDEVVFHFSDGRLRFWHMQDCCENVDLEDFELTGELDGSVILSAEEVEGDSGPLSDYEESYTWTFYKIETTSGSLFMRWYGSSNGYYGESVDVDWESN